MQHRYQYYQTGMFVIHVDLCENGILSGRIHYPFDGETDNFSGLMNLILKIEQKLDEENSPQAFHTIRTFHPHQHLWIGTETTQSSYSGKIATFNLNILFRRNASWQGSLTWVEKSQTQHYRSVLELIALLGSVLKTNQLTPLQLPPTPSLEWAE